MLKNLFSTQVQTGPLLTREEIMGLEDIVAKVITVPDTIPVWGGRSLMIKQLNRGQQDEYEKLQFGGMKITQELKAASRKGENEGTQEITGVSTYGLETWVFIQGVCNPDKSPMFTESEAQKLKVKSGEAIDWIATEILIYSGMTKGVEDLAEQIKNSSQTPTESSNVV